TIRRHIEPCHILAWSKKPQLWKSNDGALLGAEGQPRFLINGRGHGVGGLPWSSQQIGGFSPSFSQGVLYASRLSFRAALRDVLLCFIARSSGRILTNFH